MRRHGISAGTAAAVWRAAATLTVGLLPAALAQPDPSTPGWDLFLSTQLGEQAEPKELSVQGIIPPWLSGSLVRLGPGQFQVGNRSMQHQMDGFGKLHKYRISEGKVEFQTRFLRSEAYNRSMEMNDVAAHLTFLPTDPPFTWQKTLDVIQGPMDNNGIFPWCTGFEEGDVCYGAADGASPVTFDLASLHTLGHFNYSQNGNQHIGTSTPEGGNSPAHRIREVGGEATIAWQAVSRGFFPFQQHVLQIYKDYHVDGGIERRVFGSVDVARQPVMHSMAVTKNYAIAVLPPMDVNIMRMMMARAVYASMQWKKDEPTVIHIFDVRSEKEDTPPVKTFKVPSFYTNHHINAYEATGKDGRPLVIFDCIAYKDGSFLTRPDGPSTTYVSHNASWLRRTRDEYQQVVRRFTLDMGETSSSPSWVDMPLFEQGSTAEIQVEMPRFDEKRLQGSPYCIFWAQGIPKDDQTYKKFNLVKADLCTPEGPQGGRLARVWKKENHWPAEPLFVPRPGATDEDDGVLLAVVLDGPRGESYLLVLDGRTMEQLAIAYTGFVIPVDFHGQFLPLSPREVAGNLPAAVVV